MKVCMRKNTIYWLAVALGYLFVLPYPISLFCILPSDEAWTWLKQIPGKTLFNLTVMPFTFALLVEMLDYQHFVSISRSRRLFVISILTALCVFSLGFVFVTDLIDRPISPYMLRNDADREAALRLFKVLRPMFEIVQEKEELQKKLDGRVNNAPFSEIARKELDTAKKDLAEKFAFYNSNVSNYKALTSAPVTFSHYFERANWASHTTVLLNLLGVILVLLFFYHIFTHLHVRMTNNNWNRLVLVAVLMGLWFPLRVYSNWYENHHVRPDDPADLKHYYGFIMFLLIWIAAIILLVVIRAPKMVLKWVVGAQAALGTVFAFVVIYAPAAFLQIMGSLDQAPATVYSGAFVIVLIVELGIIEAVRSDISDTRHNRKLSTAKRVKESSSTQKEINNVTKELSTLNQLADNKKSENSPLAEEESNHEDSAGDSSSV
jgi:hypothetical protein